MEGRKITAVFGGPVKNLDLKFLAEKAEAEFPVRALLGNQTFKVIDGEIIKTGPVNPRKKVSKTMSRENIKNGNMSARKREPRINVQGLHICESDSVSDSSEADSVGDLPAPSNNSCLSNIQAFQSQKPTNSRFHET